MRRYGCVLAALLCLLAAPAAAEETARRSEDPGQLAREGVERLLQALDAFIDQIPQYEMPVIEENGDIIIRRKRDPEPTAGPDDEVIETET